MSVPKIKVLHIIENLDIGGAQQVVRTLVEHQAAAGCVPFVCSFNDGPLRPEIERLGVRVEVLEPRRYRIIFLPGFIADMIRIWRSSASFVIKHEIDIVQTHLLRTLDFLVLLLKYTTPVRAVFWTFHNVKFELTQAQSSKKKWLWKLLRFTHRMIYRILSRFVSGFIAVSVEVKTAILHIIGPDPTKITVICNGVDGQRYGRPIDKQRIRRLVGIDPTAYLIAVVAELTEQKGHRFLVEALKTVTFRHPDVHALFIGEGDLRKRLEEDVKWLNLEKHIHFLGYRRDIPELLGASDLFILPSLWEGLPMALLEAMATGLPVIATEVSGSTQVMIHGRTGLLVSPGDVNQLVKAIEQVISNREQSEIMGEAARMRVQRDFSARKQSEKHLALYRKHMI